MRYGQIMRCARSNPISVLYVMAYILYYKYEKKGRYLTQSYDKSPYTHRKIQKAT